MGSIKVKYLHKRRYKGQELLYWYPKEKYMVNGQWKACPFKGGQYDSLDEIQDMNDKLKEWRSGKVETIRHYEAGSVGWLVGEFKKDERFTNLAPATQKLYQYSFNDLLDAMGDFPILEVTRKRARKFYNNFTDTVRKKSQIMQNCRVVFSYAEDEELIAPGTNPFARQRISKAPAREAIWEEAQVEAVKAKAIELKVPSIALAVQMGYDLGQRPQDLRVVPWARYNGIKVKLKQQKTTNAWIEVEVLPDLKVMLDTTSRVSPTMLIDETTGKPYSKDLLCRRVRWVMTEAGIGEELQFRDLRRTAVVRLMEAGCELPEICSVTGHKLSEAEHILEVYGPRTTKQADNAIGKVKKLKEALAESKQKSKV